MSKVHLFWGAKNRSQPPLLRAPELGLRYFFLFPSSLAQIYIVSGGRGRGACGSLWVRMTSASQSAGTSRGPSYRANQTYSEHALLKQGVNRRDLNMNQGLVPSCRSRSHGRLDNKEVAVDPSTAPIYRIWAALYYGWLPISTHR